jgi:uracil-DNA glycosylase
MSSVITTPQELFEAAKKQIPYPEHHKMVHMPTLKTIGFFPGGTGLWGGNGNLVDKDVLILGQDFGNQATYEAFEAKEDDKTARSEDPNTNATWRNLLKLLKDLGIDPDRCFFSNVFMGLRSGNAQATGEYLKPRDAFYEENLAFLKTQVETIRPSMILLLGKQPVLALLTAFPGALHAWEGFNSMKDLLTDRGPIVEAKILGKKVIVAAVIHPSLSTANRPKLFNGNSGKEVSQLVAGLKRFRFPVTY